MRARVIAVRRARASTGVDYGDAPCCVPVRAAHAEFMKKDAIAKSDGDFENATKDFDNAIIEQKSNILEAVDAVP